MKEKDCTELRFTVYTQACLQLAASFPVYSMNRGWIQFLPSRSCYIFDNGSETFPLRIVADAMISRGDRKTDFLIIRPSASNATVLQYVNNVKDMARTYKLTKLRNRPWLTRKQRQKKASPSSKLNESGSGQHTRLHFSPAELGIKQLPNEIVHRFLEMVGETPSSKWYHPAELRTARS